MTSQINPADIDGNYPIAGMSNNTQGMRDNFTNTRTNFQYAADEITDLQSKAVLKAALTGTTLDNNLGNNVVYNALVKGISGTVVAIANTSGTITIDCSAGPYQSINMAGNIALSFTSNTWPTAGTLGMLRTQITVDQVGRTLTLPNTVSNGIVGIQGYASNVITFANTGTYEFGFSTTNAGNAITIVDFNRPLSYYSNDVTMAGNLTVNGDINGNITLTDISVSTVTASGNVLGGNINSGGRVSSTGNVLTSAGNVLVTGGVGGVGYTSGAGGTISQATNKATGVTLNKQSGAITMQATNLAAATIVSFVLTNSTIGANDLLLLQHQSGGTLGSYTLNAACAAGSATIYVRNNTAGGLAEALVVRYAVIKGAVA
jgi:hypothetical protein